MASPTRRKRKLRRAVSKRRCKFTPKGQRRPGRWDLWPIDYKNIDLILKFTTSQGKLYSSKRSGNSTRAQAKMKRHLKYARYMALIPYVTDN